MKNKIILLLIALLAVIPNINALTDISNCLELNATRNNLAEDYRLINDIDCSATSSWRGGKGFEPIGTLGIEGYSGNFDGQNYIITGLFINQTDTDYSALFGFVNGAYIENVNAYASHSEGNSSALLIGYANYSYVDNCSTSGTVFSSAAFGGSGYSGGVICGGYDYIVNNSWSNATVTNNAYMAGGLAGGGATNVTYDNCYAEGDVYGAYFAGGLDGATFGRIINSHATGDVTALLCSGGLVGVISYSTGFDYCVDNSYAIGTVTSLANYGTGYEHAGGLIGLWIANSCNIKDSYATGNVNGVKSVGGFIGGFSVNNINNSYSTGSITCDNADSCAGFVGYVNSGIIENSYSISDVNNIKGIYTGGFAGNSNNGIFDKCYAKGNIKGNASTGGFEGYAWSNTLINNSYSAGNVSGITQIGGFVGNINIAFIANSFSLGNVSGISNTGAFCGINNTPLGNIYFNNETSKILTDSCNAVSLSDSDMRDKSSFPAFNFCNDGYNIWAIDNLYSYPCLNYEYESCTCGAEIPIIQELNITILQPLNNSNHSENPLLFFFNFSYDAGYCSLYSDLGGSYAVVDTLYNNETIEDISSPNIIGFWRFEDYLSPSIADDSSIYDRDGNITGAAYADSKYANNTGNHSIRFNGSTDYIEVIGSSLLYDDTPLAVSFWFKINTTSSNKSAVSTFIFKAFSIYPFFSWGIQQTTSDYIGFQAINQSLNSFLILSDNPVNDTEWHYLSVVIDDNNDMFMYIDSVKQAQTTEFIGNILLNGSSTPLYFDNKFTYDYNGILDEIIILNESLDDNDIIKLYNGNFFESSNYLTAKITYNMSHTLPDNTSDIIHYYIECNNTLGVYYNSTILTVNYNNTIISLDNVSPIINITTPDFSNFTDYAEIYFIPYDAYGIDYCSLYTNSSYWFFIGTIDNNATNIFNLTLPEGHYMYYINCTDFNSNKGSSINQTLFFNVTPPLPQISPFRGLNFSCDTTNGVLLIFILVILYIGVMIIGFWFKNFGFLSMGFFIGLIIGLMLSCVHIILTFIMLFLNISIYITTAKNAKRR